MSGAWRRGGKTPYAVAARAAVVPCSVGLHLHTRAPHRMQTIIPESRAQMDADTQLRQQLVKFVDWPEAHPDFAAAAEDFPTDLRGRVPAGMPHSAWQLLEHIRI